MKAPTDITNTNSTVALAMTHPNEEVIAYVMLIKQRYSRKLTRAERRKVREFEHEAAIDLLHDERIRSVYAGPDIDTAPLVCQLDDVHALWNEIERPLPNVSEVRCEWGSTADHTPSPEEMPRLCNDFLRTVLPGVEIDEDAGLIVLQDV